MINIGCSDNLRHLLLVESFMNCVTKFSNLATSRDLSGSIRLVHALAGRHFGVVGKVYGAGALIMGRSVNSKPGMVAKPSSTHNLIGVDVSFSDHR